MAKVRKLKCNVRTGKVQRKPSLLGFAFVDSYDTGFLNTMGSINPTKCFIMMMANFMDLQGIRNMCLHCRIIHKDYLCLHDTLRNRVMLYTISMPIF